MSICKKCGIENDGTFGSGKFCGRSCANSRVRTDETKQKISEGVVRYTLSENFRNGIKNMSVQEFDTYVLNKKLNANNKLLEQPFESISEFSVKKRVTLEQDSKCNNCGLKEWLGNEIPLELEHKDGNHHNNVRDNLECLCPNCHALTSTWRGRNKPNQGKKKVSDEDMCRAYLECGNIRQALLNVGLSAKGSNYGRVKRCLTQAGIEYTIE